MAKNHVGRPTNEEVAARKRKQLLKVLVPTGIVAVISITVIGAGSLKNLMGATIGGTCEYSCEDGYTYDETGNVCYQEKTNNSEIDAYILGDASITEESSLGVLDARDKEQLSSDITNYLSENITLDERQKIVYDVNQDGNIDSYDVKAFDEVITSTVGTGGQSKYNNIYVCPESKEEVTEVGTNSLTKITTTSYKPTGENNEKCSVTITERYETEAIAYNCTGGLSATGASSSSSKKKDTTKINYVLNGGTNNKDNPSTRSFGSLVVLAVPTKTGYIFDGWYTDSKFKNRISSISPGTTKDITVYAKWYNKKLDNNFYKCIQDNLGKNPLTTKDLKGIKIVSCINENSNRIKDLSGIELLTNLEKLFLDYNELSKIDVSKNTKLKDLDLRSNKLTKIDISKNTKLVRLEVVGNKLTNLDVSKNLNLKELNIQANKLTNLDISKNTKLEKLYAGYNKLSKIDISKNLNLKVIQIFNNNLTKLNVSKNTKLVDLQVDKKVKITGLTNKTNVIRY